MWTYWGLLLERDYSARSAELCRDVWLSLLSAVRAGDDDGGLVSRLASLTGYQKGDIVNYINRHIRNKSEF